MLTYCIQIRYNSRIQPMCEYDGGRGAEEPVADNVFFLTVKAGQPGKVQWQGIPHAPAVGHEIEMAHQSLKLCGIAGYSIPHCDR